MWITILAACAPDPGEGKPKAEIVDPPAPEVVEPAPAEPAEPASAGLQVPALPQGTRLPIEKDKSSIDAVGAKITATHPIKFHTFDGAIAVDEAGKVVGVAFVADVASLEADAPKLTKHLKEPDFLDAAQFPTATFASTAIAEGAEGGTHTVTGDLTIRGQTHRVTFPATIASKDGAVMASTEFVIDRQDFGVTYPGRKDDLVQDNVVLKIAFAAH